MTLNIYSMNLVARGKIYAFASVSFSFLLTLGIGLEQGFGKGTHETYICSLGRNNENSNVFSILYHIFTFTHAFIPVAFSVRIIMYLRRFKFKAGFMRFAVKLLLMPIVTSVFNLPTAIIRLAGILFGASTHPFEDFLTIIALSKGIFVFVAFIISNKNACVNMLVTKKTERFEGYKTSSLDEKFSDDDMYGSTDYAQLG